MTSEENILPVPLAWSSERTAKRMRRMGIIPVTLDNQVDQIAGDFIASSTEAQTSAVKEEAQGTNLARPLFDSPTVAVDKSLTEGSTMASLNLTIEEASRPEGDSIPEGATRDGGLSEDGVMHEVGSKNEGGTTCEGSIKNEYVHDLTAPEAINDDYATTMAISLSGEDVATTNKDYITGQATMARPMKHHVESEASGTKKENIGVSKMDTGTKKENIGASKMNTSSNHATPQTDKKVVLISDAQEDTRFEGDIDCSMILNQSVLASPLPLTTEDLVAQDMRESYSYSSRVSKKQAAYIVKDDKEDAIMCSLQAAIEKMWNGDGSKQQGKSEILVAQSEIVEQNVFAPDKSPTAECEEVTDNAECDGEGSGSEYTANSKTCSKCCSKGLSAAK